MLARVFKWRPLLPLLLLLAAATLALAMSAHWRGARLFRQGTYVFGTRVELTLSGVPERQAQAATTAVFTRFNELHHQLHAWQPSELTRLNAAIAAGRPFRASPRLAAMLRAARVLSQQSAGLFDPGIGRRIKAWGFQAEVFGGQRREPPRAAPASGLRPSLTDLEIAPDGMISSRNRAVAIDLDGYAKGWALDEAAAILHAHGIANALIDVGGNLMALGTRAGQAWRVGIRNPRKPGALAALDLADGEAIGTSGDYYRYYKDGGIRYCHILDPRSGAPADASQSVTVLAAPAARAGALSDGASKPLFIVGPQGALPLARAMGISTVLLVDANGEVWVSPDMAGRITWIEPGIVPHLLTSPTGQPEHASAVS